MKIKHGSLFSGVGGFDLAASWHDWDNVFQVEIDKYCQKVLKRHFPNTKRYEDIKKFDGTQYRGAINVLSGGPPCQSVSVAGLRRGKSDDRWLWDEALRVCGEIKPSFVIFENPPGILSMENGRLFRGILLALESQGYKIEIFNIPVAGIEAHHRRYRIWILAYSGRWNTWQSVNSKKVAPEWYSTEKSSDKACRSSSNGREKVITYSKSTKCKSISNTWKRRNGFTNLCQNVSNSKGNGLQDSLKKSRISQKKSKHEFAFKSSCSGQQQWETESGLGRMANGLPEELDGYWDKEPEGIPRVITRVKNRRNRIKALGNAVCPKIPYIFFTIINKILNNE